MGEFKTDGLGRGLGKGQRLEPELGQGGVWGGVWGRAWNWGRDRGCLVQELDRGCCKGPGWAGTELGLSWGRPGAGQEAGGRAVGGLCPTPSNSYPHSLLFVSTPSLLCFPKAMSPDQTGPYTHLPLTGTHGPTPQAGGRQVAGLPWPSPCKPCPISQVASGAANPFARPSTPLSPPPAQPPPPQVRQPGLAGPTPLPLPPGRRRGATMLLSRPGD